MAGISSASRWRRWFSISGGCAAVGVHRRSRRRRLRKIPETALLSGGCRLIQNSRSNQPRHGRRLNAERRVVIGIEGAQLPSKPRDEALVAGVSHLIAAARIVLERAPRDHEADHSRSLVGAKRAARQAPSGKDHHVLRSARHQDSRVVAQLTLDEFAKMIAVVLHRLAGL